MIALAAVALLAVASPAGASRPAPEGAPADPGRVSIWVTAKATADRLAAKEPVVFETQAQPVEDFPTVIVDPSKTFQTIEGIGGALTDAAAETFAKLPRAPAAAARGVLRPGEGHRLHARPHAHPQLRLLERELHLRGPRATSSCARSRSRTTAATMPLIKARAGARRRDRSRSTPRPWSPPAWMKTNGDMLHGGKLKPEYRDAWARYFVALRPGVREGGRADLGAHGSERADGHADLGVLRLHGRGGARLRARPSRARARRRRASRDRQAHGLGPQPRDHVPARQGHLRRPARRRATSGARLPLVRRATTSTTCALVHDAWPDKQLLFTEGTPASYDPADPAEGPGLEMGRDLRPLADQRLQRLGARAGPTGTCCSTSRAARTTSATSASRPCTATRARAAHASRTPTTTSGTSRSSSGRARKRVISDLERGRPADDGLRQPGRQRRHDRDEPRREGHGLSACGSTAGSPGQGARRTRSSRCAGPTGDAVALAASRGGSSTAAPHGSCGAATPPTSAPSRARSVAFRAALSGRVERSSASPAPDTSYSSSLPSGQRV